MYSRILTLKERDNMKDKDVDMKMILKWIVQKYGGKLWTGPMW